ncbi:MAG: LacI family DNA-binding transcriptional regulator [Peptostreptococcaceae bacterium]|nr:LacI family DNA-binding transcriptional regulator [Peptostreptococcaceae bacterium]
MSITIKDVAKLAGVSISTVSRVINDSKPVSPDIRERVLRVIEETKYVPNPVARSLVLRKSNFIGVIVPDIANYKTGEMLNGIEEVGKIYGYDILLCNSYGEFKEEKRYIDLLLNKQVAGIIFVSWNLTEESISLLKASNIPTIYVGKNAKDFDIVSVGIDHYQAGADAAKYLLGKKFKKVCVVEVKSKDSANDAVIVSGFADEFRKKGKVFQKLDIPYSKDKIEECYQFMNDLIAKGDKLPDVFFVTGDEAAVGVVNALLDNGIKIPDQVSVLGYDNSKIAKIVRPKLTAVSQPLYDIGALAIGVLIKHIGGQDTNEKVTVLPHSIVERESVR